MAYTSLEEIRGNCLECGECWEWQGHAASCGTPKINAVKGGKRNVFSGRRVVWEFANGKALPSNVLLTTNCGNPRCLNPDHLAKTDHSKIAKKVGARLDVRLKKVARSGRPIKLDAQKAAEIRASTLKNSELAKMYGVTKSSISRTRNNRCWAQPNPFGGLL
jgi:hypothetical protein